MPSITKRWALIHAALALCICLIGAAGAEVVAIYSKNGSEVCRFNVEFAVSPAEQSRGLMFRKNMDEKTGMFFIFNDDEVRRFWMKNTLIPLDMIFIDKSFLVVAVHRNAKPLDEKIISSGKPARYVLEVNAGEADKCRIKPGTKVKVLIPQPGK